MKSYQSYQNQTKNVQNEQTKALFKNNMTFFSKVKKFVLRNFGEFWKILVEIS